MNRDKSRYRSWAVCGRNLFWWALASLVAIALLLINPLLGLAAALAGGIAFGLALFQE
jgi:hypothetical protein